MSFREEAKNYPNPEIMAENYLSRLYGDKDIEYPINPFKLLKDEGILFSFMDFKKLEGVYIPSSDKGDVPVVGISVNRPITRQRFTAAHELCHHFRDADKNISCPISRKKNKIEAFADGFAAALLMPIKELRLQVSSRLIDGNSISLNDVLDIADYFGVSFEACLYRIAYKLYAIDGDTSSEELKKRIKQFKPDKVREARNMTYTKLYVDLIDSFQDQLRFEPSEFAKNVFQNEYIYNDSRMEGNDITLEQASEIVTDLRLNVGSSEYSDENSEGYMSIAGHYDMYQAIFALPVKETISVFDMFSLNKLLFSHYPYPEYGGTLRQNNTLVLGAKFETTDYKDIVNELSLVDKEVKDYFARRNDIPVSEYVMHVVRTHHRITKIHPFCDGNGRTSRAFMNVQLVRANLMPIYIKTADKRTYVKALMRADKYQDYDALYELIFSLIIRSFVDLNCNAV